MRSRSRSRGRPVGGLPGAPARAAGAAARTRVHKRLGPDAALVNFAAYAVEVVDDGGRPAYDREVRGMWELEHYVSLLLGEMPRLTDDEHGYGPNGRGFIAHVDVPDEVHRAFDAVGREFGAAAIRPADPRWAGLTGA